MFLERIGETDVTVDSDKELIAFFYELFLDEQTAHP